MLHLNNRQRALLMMLIAALFLAAVTVCGAQLSNAAAVTDFSRRSLSPCLQYPFGTDWLGRDMLARTLCGLSLSIRIGLLTATISAGIALLLGTAAALLGKAADTAVSLLIDLLMGVPHLLLLLLISFACGRGLRGVMTGVTLTHWMALARLMRAEILHLRGSGYVLAAQKLGIGRARIARIHILPHLLPQFLTGLILLFPHAILHEAGITFLGFGLPPEQPAIGVILSESIGYLAAGRWWLAMFPGLMLALTVLMFSAAGECLRQLSDPGSAHL